MIISIFEDEMWANMVPLTLTRPVYALRCGVSLIYEKILSQFPHENVVFFLRGELIKIFLESFPERNRILGFNDLEALRKDDVLLVNGRWIFRPELLETGEEVIHKKNGVVVYAYAKAKTLEKIVPKCKNLDHLIEILLGELPTEETDDAKLIEYPWDLIEMNTHEISYEFNYLTMREYYTGMAQKMNGVYVVGDEAKIKIGKNVRIYPNVVLETTDGPIVIEEHVIIKPNTYVVGPCYIGPNSWLVGGTISQNSIGPVCRVGGEVDNTIIHGYSNKYHLGFLGNSYVGEWVNIGAQVTTTNLRNDYDYVKVFVGGKLVNSGRQKVGAFIGDHTKIGSGTIFNPGTIIGVMCNIVSSGRPCPKYIPSFTWFINGKIWDNFGVEEMIKAAKRMMARRTVTMTINQESYYEWLYEVTAEERMVFKEKIFGQSSIH